MARGRGGSFEPGVVTITKTRHYSVEPETDLGSARRAQRISNFAADDADTLSMKSRNKDRALLNDITTRLVNNPSSSSIPLTRSYTARRRSATPQILPESVLFIRAGSVPPRSKRTVIEQEISSRAPPRELSPPPVRPSRRLGSFRTRVSSQPSRFLPRATSEPPFTRVRPIYRAASEPQKPAYRPVYRAASVPSYNYARIAPQYQYTSYSSPIYTREVPYYSYTPRSVPRYSYDYDVELPPHQFSYYRPEYRYWSPYYTYPASRYWKEEYDDIDNGINRYSYPSTTKYWSSYYPDYSYWKPSTSGYTYWKPSSSPYYSFTMRSPASHHQAVRAAKMRLDNVERELGIHDGPTISEPVVIHHVPSSPRTSRRPAARVASPSLSSTRYRSSSLPPINAQGVPRTSRAALIETRVECDPEFYPSIQPESLSTLRGRASSIRNKMDSHKTMLDRYLPIHYGPENDVQAEVDYKFGELVNRMPSLDQHRPHQGATSSAGLGSVPPYKPASTHGKPPSGLHGPAPRGSFRPQVSETRKRIREVLCATKNDPHYYG